jgi:hypothetical protein
MATAIEVQAELDPDGTGKLITIIKAHTIPTPGTTTLYYCIGGQGLAGRARWCEATTADSAANQAISITNAMEA